MSSRYKTCMELFAQNPHYTEQVLSALVAACNSLQRVQNGDTGDKAKMCADASITAVYCLLDEHVQRVHWVRDTLGENNEQCPEITYV